MSQKKYASLSTLQTFLDNLKTTFSHLGHKHTISDVTDYVVDNALSSTSVNPVQNKVLNAEFDEIAVSMRALDLAVDGKADASHTHPEATQTTSGLLNASNKIQLDMGGTPIITTSGTGAAYTATVDGMTLTAGVSFIMIPHTVSTTTAPTLNINGLGAKSIRRRLSSATTSTTQGYNNSWLSANKPIRVTYDGAFWIADLPKPSTADLSGTVAVTQGGTGATDAATARENLEITPENIGAATSEHAHAISEVTNLQVALDTLTENKSDKTHTHADATTTASGMMSAEDKVKLNNIEEKATNGIQRVNMTSEDGAVWTATIDGVEELTNGKTFLFVPNRTSSSTTPTLNVNGLGAVTVRRKMSSGTATLCAPNTSTLFFANRPTLLMYDTATVNGTPYWIALEFTKPSATDLYGYVPVQNGGWYVNSNTTDDDLIEAREAFGVYSKADHDWVQIYDSGEITEVVNAISGINISGYKNIKIAVQNVNDGTNTTASNAGIIFTAKNGTTYQFNVFNNLFNTTSGRTSGGLAHFNVRDGWLTCEYSLYNYNISNKVFADTEGGTAAKFSAFSGGGIAKCTNELSTLTVTSYNQDASCFFGVGSRVIVWGCKI